MMTMNETMLLSISFDLQQKKSINSRFYRQSLKLMMTMNETMLLSLLLDLQQKIALAADFTGIV